MFPAQTPLRLLFHVDVKKESAVKKVQVENTADLIRGNLTLKLTKEGKLLLKTVEAPAANMHERCTLMYRTHTHSYRYTKEPAKWPRGRESRPGPLAVPALGE